MRFGKRNVKKPTDNLFVISLFSGAMGLDLGLERAGFKTRAAVEINNAAVGTMRLNRPKLPIVSKSIRDTTTYEILEAAGLCPGEVTVISAGPCCQTFSTVGKRRSVADERGGLFREFCRIVAEARPRFFVMENVKGILSAAKKHRPLDERGPGFPPLCKEELLGSALGLILEELGNLNYYVVFGLLNAADHGVPQKRWRVFFIGSRDGEDISLLRPTHYDPRAQETLGSLFRRRLLPWVTLRKALNGVHSEHWSEFTKERLELLRRLEPGQDWRDLPPHLHRRALGAALDSWGGRTGFCRRLSWDEPAPTLTTAPDGRATTLCHPTEGRPLSIEEYAVLQEFPRKWKFAGSIRQQYVQIGNAVPLGLGEGVGRMLRRVMRATAQTGLSQVNYRRRGLVVCGDAGLEERLANRKKTQLHPPHLRMNPDPEAAREWLEASA